jgi:hypothetical protein
MMTALVGQDVKRTFSAVGSYSAGLPSQRALKADGQKLRNLFNAVVSHIQKLNQILAESSR